MLKTGSKRRAVWDGIRDDLTAVLSEIPDCYFPISYCASILNVSERSLYRHIDFMSAGLLTYTPYFGIAYLSEE
jgi:hypothetical protein